jgi:hypothetical protein
MTEEELKRIIKMPTACDRSMTLQEIYGVSRLLEGHHSLFYMIWEMGRPVFTNDLPTAAVVYDPKDKSGKTLGWYMNPEFWDSIDNYTRAFVLGHESLHILFNHIKRHALDKRYKVSEDGKYIYDDSALANIAQDVVINHALLNTFGFDRSMMKGWEQWCWVDTIWPDNPNTPQDECFEYYYELLKEDMGNSKSLRLMDSHEYLDIPEEVREQIEKALNESLSEDEKKQLRDMIEQHVVGGPDGGEGKESSKSSKDGKQAGKDAVGAWIFVSKPKPIRKPKWETIVRDKVKMIIQNQYGMVEQWAQKQRNHMSLPTDLKLPAEIEDYDIVMNKAKIDLVFFLDASGSCYGMADRFFKAAATVPRNVFNVHLCSFDTRVYQLDINSPKMVGGGGTSFHIMEDFIQAKLKSGEMKRYPDAVFVITDGYGDNIHPEKPKHWFWFMTEKYFSCIPSSSHKFMLSEFE